MLEYYIIVLIKIVKKMNFKKLIVILLINIKLLCCYHNILHIEALKNM